MLNAFLPGRIGPVAFAPTDSPEPLHQAVWIDVADPLAWEKPMVEEALGVALPSRSDMTEIEASSRTYREDGALFLTVPLVVGLASDDPRSVPVTFILSRQRLITMRYGDPQPFRTLNLAYGRTPPPADPMAVLLRLLELIVGRAADTLERMGAEIDEIARRIFGAPADRRLSTEDLNMILRRIGLTQFVLTKEHESLAALARSVAFLGVPLVPAEGAPARRDRAHRDTLKSLQRDIHSLNENSAFLFSNLGFLLDAAMGRISVEQSAIIKIFSVAAVVLLPPTMVASIYGMNFEFMPELVWPLGYPMALLLMVLSSVVPYLLFKRKGWL
ncbi:MAG: magnesium transporter CorA family protein [Thermaurantiacus sp.]